MAVKLGVAIVSTDIEEYVRQVRMLDEAGVDMIGCGDSQALYHEQFIRCALAAEHSRRAPRRDLDYEPNHPTSRRHRRGDRHR